MTQFLHYKVKEYGKMTVNRWIKKHPKMNLSRVCFTNIYDDHEFELKDVLNSQINHIYLDKGMNIIYVVTEDN